MTKTLDNFCDRIIADDHPIRRLEPEGLAAEFTDYFRVPLRVSLEDLTVLLECAGVGDVSERPLAGGLRGIHYIQPDGTYAIHYLEGQWEGTSKLTVLHETFEIIHEQVWDRCHDCQPTRSVCPEAERFAAATLMPREVFAAYAQVGGLDAVALQNLFHCAYSAVALRMSEVMLGQPLMLALYERTGQDDPAHWPIPTRLGDLRVTVMRRTAGMGMPRSRLLNGWRGGAPRKGKALSAGSLAERAARSGRPEYDEGDGIAVAARPVLWKGRLSKVAVVAVPWEHRRVLEPQLAAVRRGPDHFSPVAVPRLAAGWVNAAS
ncbi:MAG: ImmA/IrrE family metallo-endopeptidase [Chloroflexota bacterium]|nr:ImmA/IrrE family metallo-endopeptidase [Chloroflexota bacterium]